MADVIDLNAEREKRSFPDANDPAVQKILKRAGAQLFTHNGVTRAVLHLMTQDNQPYGSERRCCEECGTMILYTKLPPHWTDDRKLYKMPDKGFISCSEVWSIKNRSGV